MKPVRDDVLDHLEETTLQCSQALRAYLVYQGDNPTYEKKARVAATHISAWARARASESNRQAIELMEARLQKQLPASRR